jgi:hypothetical protein
VCSVVYVFMCSIVYLIMCSEVGGVQCGVCEYMYVWCAVRCMKMCKG